VRARASIASMRPSVLGVVLTLLVGCPDRGPAAGPSARAQPRPLEPLLPQAAASDGGEPDREALYRVTPLAPVGPAVPADATRVLLDGERATLDGKPLVASALRGSVVLAPGPDTWLVQVAPLLAALDDAHLPVFLEHPDAPLAFPVVLRDEPAFQAWLDEAVPGKVRVIHRADGFELQTNMGKLPGGDPNGPTVPVRGGRMDLATLQRGLERVRGRFRDAPDVCFVPSFGMELQQTIRALAADYLEGGRPVFGQLCLVYPRPPRDAGR
jgi:hypothetical protein